VAAVRARRHGGEHEAQALDGGLARLPPVIDSPMTATTATAAMAAMPNRIDRKLRGRQHRADDAEDPRRVVEERIGRPARVSSKST
jgi:hypothetical protein